jgi:hypothetical protein
MKYIYSLILVFFTQSITFSQGLNGEIGFNDNYSQTATKLVVVNEFSYFINEQQQSSSFYTRCYLHKVDTLGNLVWKMPIDFGSVETSIIFELIASENGGVYIAGKGMTTCDVISNCIWYLQKYNANGSLAWTKTWDDITCSELTISALSLIETNNLILNYTKNPESRIVRFNANGSILDSLEITKTELQGIRNFINFEKIGHKQKSIFGFDSNGIVSNTLSFSKNVQGIEVLSDTLFVLTLDSIYVFDSNFQLVRSSNIPTYSNYSNLKVKTNQIEFISHGLNDQFIFTLNHNLNLINTLTIPVKLALETPKDFNDTHLAVAFNYDLTAHQAIRHLDYSRFSAENAYVNWTDIGIIDIQQTQVSAEQITPGAVYEIKIYADVLIKNFGNATLNDCRINHFISPTVACNLNYYTEHFSNLNLAPNDSMWISLGLIHTEINYFPNNTISKNICVYTSHPNYKTDLNVSNDNFCKTILVGYVDVNELAREKLVIYPNPAHTTLNLKSNLPYLSYTIFSTQGVQIQSGNVDSQQIDIRQLASGMYILRLSAQEGLNVSQVSFIKE